MILSCVQDCPVPMLMRTKDSLWLLFGFVRIILTYLLLTLRTIVGITLREWWVGNKISLGNDEKAKDCQLMSAIQKGE